MKVLRASLMSAAVVLELAACAGEDDGRACRAACDDLCTAFDACGVQARSPSCAEDCSRALAGADCSEAKPANQLTCDELAEVHACAAHCAAVCRRAAECATFDEELCAAGCGADGPFVCNAASVPVRSCDQVKVEARRYEDAGRALREGDDFGSGSFFSGPNPYGLCKSANDCDAPTACNAVTNACGPCTTDAECDRGSILGASICSAGQCVDVECTADDDCPAGVCDTGRNVCVMCRTNADCTGGTLPACNPMTFACVQCVTDADCAASAFALGPFCNATTSRCVGCRSDLHCTDSYAPRCDLGLGFCRP